MFYEKAHSECKKVRRQDGGHTFVSVTEQPGDAWLLETALGSGERYRILMGRRTLEVIKEMLAATPDRPIATEMSFDLSGWSASAPIDTNSGDETP